MEEKHLEALNYLHDKVEKAYLNGDIGTVKHLCGLAGERLIDNTTIENSGWILTYLITCIKYDSDYYFIKDLYDNKINKSENNDINVLFDFILKILHPQITNETIESCFNNILNIDGEAYEDRLFMAILIEKVIEVFWYLNNEKCLWQKISEKFLSVLKEKNKIMLRDTIELLNKRLIIQHGVINDWRAEDTNLKNRSYEKSELVNMLAKSWYYFFSDDWVLLDSIIPELIKRIPFESEYFMSLQGLVNMSKRQRELIKGEYSDNTYSSVYRYKRIQLEKPLTVYNFERIVQIEKLNSEIKINPYNSSTQRGEILRLIILTYLDSLKFWDLGSYYQIISNKAQFELSLSLYFNKFGKYCGMIDWGENAIISSIQSNKRDVLKTDEFKILIGVLETQKKESLSNIIEYILFKSKKSEWYSCAEWLELIGDSIPMRYISDVIRWTIEFKNHEDTQKHRFNSQKFNYLIKIIKHFQLTVEQWIQMYELIDLLFSNSFYWHVCGELLETILEKIPKLKCIQLFDTIKRYSYDNDMQRYIIGYIFNTSLDRLDVKEEGITILTELYQQTEDKEYENYANILKNQTINEQIETDFEKYEKMLEQHIEKFEINANTPGYSGYARTSEKYTNINWGSADNEVLDRMFTSIRDIIIREESKLFEDNFSELLKILRQIALRSNDMFKKNVINLIIDLIRSNYKTKPTPFINDDSPIQGFKIISNIYSHQRSAYLLLIGEFISYIDNKENKIYLLKWCINELLTSEKEILYYHAHIYSYMFIIGNKEEKEIAYTGLMMLYTIICKSPTKTDDEIVKILHAIEGLFKPNYLINNSTLAERIYSEENCEFYSFINRIIELSYKSFNYLTRLECAKIIVSLIKQENLIKDYKLIEEILKNDVRASIRNVFVD